MMDYSAANHELWNAIIQLGYIDAVLLIALLTRHGKKLCRLMLIFK